MLRDHTDFDFWMQGWSTSAPTTYQGSDELAFQRWFKFKEAFSPALVRQIIEALPQRPQHLLDCFGGSGTSGVVARLCDVRATLIEVNPFLADLIEAKLADYRGFDLPTETTRLLSRAENIAVSLSDLRDRLPPTFVEPGVDQRWIFGQGAAKMIERLRLAIRGIRTPVLKRMFHVALGSILIEASNVRIDGKGRRYRSNWEERRIGPATVRKMFLDAVGQIIEDVAHFPVDDGYSYAVQRGDAREQIRMLPRDVDFAIFSPPYPNSFDYTDIYNVELWMMGYLTKAEDNAKLRLQTMRSHVQVHWKDPTNHLNSATLSKTIARLRAVKDSLWNRRIPDMVVAYFEDLDGIIEDIENCLAPGGHIAIVIGNSSYAGITVDSSAILEELAARHKLRVKKCESVRVMRSSSQQSRGDRVLDEWLILLSRD